MGNEQHSSVQILILASLKRIELDVRELRAELSGFNARLQRLEVELAVFKAKAVAYGAMAGVVSGAIVSAIVSAIARDLTGN